MDIETGIPHTVLTTLLHKQLANNFVTTNTTRYRGSAPTTNYLITDKGSVVWSDLRLVLKFVSSSADIAYALSTLPRKWSVITPSSHPVPADDDTWSFPDTVEGKHTSKGVG